MNSIIEGIQMTFIIIGGGILFAVICLTIGYISERVKWNKGVCAENGIAWKPFDMDSQGATGYKAGDEAVWISYPFVANNKEKWLSGLK